jgi:hypothetical protein
MRNSLRLVAVASAIIAQSQAVLAQPIDYPKFTGEISLTAQNDGAFEAFLDEHEAKVVFLDMTFNTAFGARFSSEVYEMCSPYAEIWDNGLSGEVFTLPYTKDGNPLGEDEVLKEENTECGDVSLSFVSDDLVMSSAGPGVHWYDIKGFYLVRRRANRQPYVEIKELDASAETWARMQGQ